MDKRIIAIGGGEIKSKTTLKIDEYVAKLAKERAGDKRACGLFIGTASHDSMPYFNSFRKTYTSVFDIKVDCALTVYGEMDLDRIKEKFAKADFLYIGGGNTIFMIEKWKQFGLYDLICDAYQRGVIICGLSAGAICWFKKMYTDYGIMIGKTAEYEILDGLDWLDGLMTPHYNERQEEFDEKFKNGNFDFAYAVENDCALEFVNGKLTKSISSGGNAYLLTKNGCNVEKNLIL